MQDVVHWVRVRPQGKLPLSSASVWYSCAGHANTLCFAHHGTRQLGVNPRSYHVGHPGEARVQTSAEETLLVPSRMLGYCMWGYRCANMHAPHKAVMMRYPCTTLTDGAV